MPRNHPQMPAGKSGTVSLASTALVTLTLLAASTVMLATCSHLLAPTFNDRWPVEEFKPFPQHNGHLLPRAPLSLWWHIGDRMTERAFNKIAEGLREARGMLKIAATATRYGRMAYYVDDQYIGYCLERYGEYSEAEPALWRKLIKPGDIALDIGANIGALTLPLAEMVGPEGRVHAFEPHLQNHMLLQNNCYGHANVEVWNDALGSEVTFADAPRLETLPHTNYGGIEFSQSQTGMAQVMPLDHLSFWRVDFMKIDVEGWEIDVIHGAMLTINRDRPLMYVEVDRPDVAQRLAELLKDIDYVSFPHEPRLCSSDNWKKRRVGRYENIISKNVLCIPNERAAEVAKAIFR